MRFPFGTVGSILPAQDRGLSEIDEGGRILFRILVVDEGDKVGRLLAMADKIAPIGDEQQRDALLPLGIEDLGEAIWRLDAPEDSAPRLLLNSRFPGLKQKLLEDPLLMGAILPKALRDALLAIRSAAEDPGEWLDKWKKFVTEMGGEAVADRFFDGEDDDDDIAEIIDDICRQLVDRRKYVSRALLVHAAGHGDA